jgi:predicted signal transduction protein with EAL and GGDEF domain
MMVSSSVVSHAADILQLSERQPDLVLAIRRDGTLLAFTGGRMVPALLPHSQAIHQPMDSVWPTEAAAVLKQLCRKAIASRGSAEAWFHANGMDYEARVIAEGPDRALCVIRAARNPQRGSEAPDGAASTRAALDRRGFLDHFQQALAIAALKEVQAALIVVDVEGIEDIADIDGRVAQEVFDAALLRLRDAPPLGTVKHSDVGPLNESQLCLVIETADRVAIEEFVSRLQANLRQPVHLHGNSWHLSCFAGVSLLGRDASAPKELLDQARIAAGEARRAAAVRPQFFSDTMKLKSVARLDVARELHDAVRAHALGMRYVGRHDLVSGRLDAVTAYVTWPHALRGEVSPKEFLGVAESTGMAAPLSREMLSMLRRDVARLTSLLDVSVRFSYGPLRHHLLHEDFVADIEQFLRDSALPAERLEIRIAERTFVAIAPNTIERLAQRGMRIVIDEVGRSMGSFSRLASLPLWGLQLDRSFVEDLQGEGAALRLCRAGIAAAGALGLSSIATGVDDAAKRQVLLESGCRFGTGDLFDNSGLDAAGADARAPAAS